MKGTVHVNQNIMLENVYYSPDFNVNLISVSRLTSTSSYMISFTDKHAVLFDKVMKMEAGRASAHQGLYFLTHSPGTQNSFNFVGTLSFAIWHNRLGHTCSDRMHFIFKTLNLSCNDDLKECDACHLAKKKRTSFPKDASRACKPFDVVHMDVWGSFPHNT